MIATGGAGYWLTSSDSFVLDEPRVEGELHYTDAAALLAAAGLDRRLNVVLLDTARARRSMLAFASVADAQVRVALPNEVVVRVVERQPVFALGQAGTNYLVDAGGAVVATLGDTEAAALGIPVVRDDRREWAVEVEVGSVLNEIDLAAIVQLAAIGPAQIGSAASSLALTIDDADGYVLSALPSGWRAVFGHYTPTLRPPDMIARQVQCLGSIIAGGEQQIDTIYLAPLDERCGTYLPRTTPRASPTPDTGT